MMPADFETSFPDADPTNAIDDLTGFVVNLGVRLAIRLAAPLIVLVLAGVLLSVELPVLIVFAIVLLLARFAGLTAWRIVSVDQLSGKESIETTRNLLRARRRIRGINDDRRIYVRWAWC
jgi:hypothetical protein